MLCLVCLPMLLLAAPADEDALQAEEELRALAELHAKQGEHDKAIEIYDELLKASPDDHTLLEALLASCMDSEACRPRRLEIIHAALKVFPDRPDLTEDYFAILKERKESTKALAMLKEYVARNPGQLGIQIVLIEGLLESGQPIEAVKELRAYLLRQPDSLRLRMLLVETLVELGRQGEAVNVLSEQVRLRPKMVGPRFELIDLLQELQRGDQLDEVLEDLMRDHADNAKTWVLVGDRALEKDDLSYAEEALKKARTLKANRSALRMIDELERDIEKTKKERYADWRAAVRWDDLEEALEQRDDY